jgi:SAM-dependent methyltransferase
VFAVDVQPEMVALLRELVARSGLDNVRPVLGSERSTGLAPASVDLALLVDVYHELAFPYEVMASIVQALRPGGRVVLVEYRAEDLRVPIKPLHKMSEAQARREMALHPLGPRAHRQQPAVAARAGVPQALSGMAQAITFANGGGSLPALVDQPARPRAALVLGHGAGAGMDHPFLEQLAQGLAARAIATLRFQFPFMERRIAAAPIHPPSRRLRCALPWPRRCVASRACPCSPAASHSAAA